MTGLLPILLPVLLPVLTGFAIALLMCAAVRHAGILDHPNARSSHRTPTPRGGGLGAMAGLFAGLCLLPVAAPADSAALAGIAAGGAAAAALGLGDDLFVLGERLKFVLLSVIALAVAAMAGPVTDLGLPLPWLVGLAGSALWVFTLANAVNFMDGSDGLLVACLVPAALVLAVLDGMTGPTAAASLVLAAAVAGFGVFNLPLLAPRGRLFCGDVGSLGLAVIWAGLALHWAAAAPSGSVFLVPLPVLPLLGDVLLTLAARARAGQSLFTAHRAHAYQLLIRMGHSHARIAALWCALSLAGGTLALTAAATTSPWPKLTLLAAGAAGFAVFHSAVRRSAKAKGLDTVR